MHRLASTTFLVQDTFGASMIASNVEKARRSQNAGISYHIMEAHPSERTGNLQLHCRYCSLHLPEE
jgi:hypothetical protein